MPSIRSLYHSLLAMPAGPSANPFNRISVHHGSQSESNPSYYNPRAILSQSDPHTHNLELQRYQKIPSLRGMTDNCFSSCTAFLQARNMLDNKMAEHCRELEQCNLNDCRHMSTTADLHHSSAQAKQSNMSSLISSKDRDGDASAGSGSTSCTPRPRWCPTQEQISVLEHLFESGLTTPSREMIAEIASHLKQFGSIVEANVFYWFQNRKARAKRKLLHVNISGTAQSASGVGHVYDNNAIDIPNTQSDYSASYNSTVLATNPRKRRLPLSTMPASHIHTVIKHASNAISTTTYLASHIDDQAYARTVTNENTFVGANCGSLLSSTSPSVRNPSPIHITINNDNELSAILMPKPMTDNSELQLPPCNRLLDMDIRTISSEYAPMESLISNMPNAHSGILNELETSMKVNYNAKHQTHRCPMD